MTYEIVAGPYGGPFQVVSTDESGYRCIVDWCSTLEDALRRAAQHAGHPLALPLIARSL